MIVLLLADLSHTNKEEVYCAEMFGGSLINKAPKDQKYT
jgi:hypothetical protein